MNDTTFDNGLTPAEAERLAVLAEECAEVVQAVGKILRHGWESTYDNGTTNRQQLEIELGDVQFARGLLQRACDISIVNVHAHADLKRQSLQDGSRFYHHQHPHRA